MGHGRDGPGSVPGLPGYDELMVNIAYISLGIKGGGRVIFYAQKDGQVIAGRLKALKKKVTFF
jgi:hypothetical protein